MDITQLEKLVEKYLEAETTIEEEKQLVAYFQNNQPPERFQSMAEELLYFHDLNLRSFPGEISSPWEKEKSGFLLRKGNFQQTVIGIAASVLLFLSGFMAGHFFNKNSELEDRLLAVEGELFERKRTEALSLINQHSPNQRLAAISLLNEVTEMGPALQEALINTFRDDPNENVRLAALNILYLHVENAKIRDFLLNELFEQRSLIILSSLVDVLSDLNEEMVKTTLSKYSNEVKNPKEIREKILQKLSKS